MKKIKKISQNLFKRVSQEFFKLLYGKISYKSNNQKSRNISIKFIKKKSIRKFDNTLYRVFKVKNGRIYTDDVENVAIIDKNKIIDDISFQQISGELLPANHNSSIEKGTPRILKTFRGNVLSLIQGASGKFNYYHWLFDILPKIKLFSEIYNLKDIDYIYFHKLKNFQKNTLKILGILKKKIIFSERYRHIQAENIFCTDHPIYFNGFIETESKKIPKWIVRWLRSTFLKHKKKFNCNDKIFIDRSSSPSKHCQFINNEEIKNYLKKRGFKSYKIEKLNFFKEIYLFNKAKIIIGAHGAGLANLAFCKSKTKVIEIRPKNRINSLYQRISHINNLNYNLIETKIIRNSRLLKVGDIKLDISILKKYLN